MNVDEAMKVTIDFEHEDLPQDAKEFQPLVFKDGDRYCCLLGPNPTQGIVGWGETPKAAIADWSAQLQERIKVKNEDDEVATFVRDTLNTSNEDVW